MKSKVRNSLIACAVLFVAQGAVSNMMFPTWKKNYSSGNTGVASGLTPDQLFAAVAGLRQFVAGVLWVQADEFFDSGQFDAVLPIIRLVTWLDPKQLEVYSTGSWHIAYNFTDEQNRSDRRYIPLALRLLEEGVQQNKDTFKLYHDSGWIYFHKVDDSYEKAVKWFEQSVTKPDIFPALRSILGQAYIKNGQLDEAVVYYWKIQQEFENSVKANPGDFEVRTRRDTSERNLDNLLVRMVSRGVIGKREGVYEKYPYDTRNPIELNFGAKIETLSPKVLRVTGKWNIPTTGGRIRMTVRNADYDLQWAPAPSLDFEIDSDKTYMQDQLFLKNGQFDRRIDMSRNPTMYPFKGEKYYIEFFYSPRNAPLNIQDRIGYNGEGFIDKRYTNETIRPGQRVLFCQLEVTRDFIFKKGDYQYSAVMRTPGFVDITTREMEGVIERVPRGSLRN